MGKNQYHEIAQTLKLISRCEAILPKGTSIYEIANPIQVQTKGITKVLMEERPKGQFLVARQFKENIDT